MSWFWGIVDKSECFGGKKEREDQKKQKVDASISQGEDCDEKYQKALMIFYLLVPFPNKVNDNKAF